MAISKKRSFAVADDMVFNIDKPNKKSVKTPDNISSTIKEAALPQAEKVEETKNSFKGEDHADKPKDIKEENKIAKSVGRPRGDAKKAVTIYIPLDTYDDMNNGPIPLLRGKVSEYIVSLIEADLKENEDTYKKISNVLTASRGN